MSCRTYFAATTARLATTAITRSDLTACTSHESTTNKTQMATRATTICMSEVTYSANIVWDVTVVTAPRSCHFHSEEPAKCSLERGRAGSSCQRGAVSTGGQTCLAAENPCQVALIGEPDPVSDLGEGLIGSAHQSLCALQPAPDNVTLRTDSDRLFEASAEVIRAETGHASEIGQGQPIVQMGFDVFPHSLQPVARQSIRRLEREHRSIDKTSRDL